MTFYLILFTQSHIHCMWQSHCSVTVICMVGDDPSHTFHTHSQIHCSWQFISDHSGSYWIRYIHLAVHLTLFTHIRTIRYIADDCLKELAQRLAQSDTQSTQRITHSDALYWQYISLCFYMKSHRFRYIVGNSLSHSVYTKCHTFRCIKGNIHVKSKNKKKSDTL